MKNGIFLQNGINLIRIAENALADVHGMLNRMITLATRSANGTYTDAECAGLSGEMTQLKTEIDRIGSSSNFNGIALFQGGNTPNVAEKRVYNYEMTLDLKTGTCSVLSSGVNAGFANFDSGGVVNEYQPGVLPQCDHPHPRRISIAERRRRQ